jgi:hypothetical protein
VLLQREETFEYRRRAPDEQLLVDEIQQLVDGLKIRVDRPRGKLGGKQPGMHVLQQHDADLANRLGRPVIALHQQFGRAPLGSVGQPEVASERGLHIEHQPILAATGKIVQADAQVAQQPLLRTTSRASDLSSGPARQNRATIDRDRSAGDPHDRLQIAQPPGFP